MTPWNRGESYDPEPFTPNHPLWRKKRPNLTFGTVLWCFVIIGAAVLVWAVSGALQRARAHVADHPEWNEVLGASLNRDGGSCCGLGDVHLLDFDDWRETASGYEVLIEGEWQAVHKWQLTSNQPNPTGKALVWYSVLNGSEAGSTYHYVVVYCFKPLNTY